MAAEFDYESEGLLEGLSDRQREARVELLDRLLAEGAEPDELREAAIEGRLALLPLERALAGEERFTPREVAERSGVDQEILDRQWLALGMAVGDHDQPTQTRDDLRAAERVREFLDAGLDPEAMAETGRVMAMVMSQVAAANRQLIGELAGAEERSSETELELAERLEGLATALVPLIGPALEHIYKLQLREQIRHAAIDSGAPLFGEGPSERMAVAFADLVGFTRLGEELPPEEFGRITGRFAELANEVATGPVRLVKLIGDAAMLAGSEPGELATAALRLIDLVEREGEGFPAVRAGLSMGPVLPRAGDLYGRTVNLASRLTGAARPASLLVSSEVREELDGEFNFSNAGHKRLKGIDGRVSIYRCRELEGDAED